MKKIIYPLLSVIIILVTTVSCEDLTDVPNNVPTVTTGNVSSVRAYTALIRKTNSTGKIYEKYEYLMIDTAESFRDQNYIQNTTINIFGEVLWSCQNLYPNTKYYYRQCAFDGLEYVYGETKSFTTEKLISVNSIKLAAWGDSTSLSNLTGVDAGAYLVDSAGYSNANTLLKYNSNEFVWSATPEIQPSTKASRLYVYAPYVSSLKDFNIYQALYKYNTDFVYGYSNILDKNNTSANITMHHAFADVVFSVTRSANDNVGSSLSDIKISYYNNTDSILANGNFNLINGSWTKIGMMNEIVRGFTKFVPDTKTPTDIDVYFFPASYAAGKLTLSLGSIEVSLPACNWKAGYRYVYPVTVSQSKLVLGDVQIVPWTNNDAGNININN